MNVKEHIESGHYPKDDKGRALVMTRDGLMMVIVATDCPAHMQPVLTVSARPILGWLSAGPHSHTQLWDEDGRVYPDGQMNGDLLPPPPRKVEVKWVARLDVKNNIICYCQIDNPVNRAEVSANVMQYGGQMVLLTGSYEEPW